MTTLRPAIAGLIVVALAAPGRAAAPAAVRGFLKANCIACHDDASATANLSVESLGDDLTDPRWVRIHDRVAAGEMPPRDEEQPKPADRKAFTTALGGGIAKAVAARQAAEGRVVLRRMNRREYENALHDLLGIAVPLQELLPDDQFVDGFDTATSGLELSPTHLLAYQRAADAALAAALPVYPLEPLTLHWTGRQYLEKRLPVHRPNVDPFMRLDGDALVLHAYTNTDATMYSQQPPVPGRYRVRASVRTVNDPRPLQSVLVSRKADRFQKDDFTHLIGYHDVPAGKPTIIEDVTVLGHVPNYRVASLVAVSLPRMQDFQKARGPAGKEPLPADFAGPGLAVDWIELYGPLDVGLGYRRLFGDLPREPQVAKGQPPPKNWQSWKPDRGEFRKFPLGAVSADPKADAARLIRGFLPLAFRRQVPEDLAARYVGVAHTALAAGRTFDASMREAYKAILCSPYFLCYVEEPGRLDDYAVASRLARFLWSSVPDEALLSAAAAGRLTKPEELRAETERMLADPKAGRFPRDFTDLWLALRQFHDMKPDGIYVEADDELRQAMPEETRAFFGRMLADDAPAASILDSDWTMLNDRLARHYGIDGVAGAEFRRVALKPTHHRGGVITQASFLKLSTNASYTSPVKRGAWVLERILDTPPQPPPPTVKAVPPDTRGATTIREQLALHKNQEACAACHRTIDPPGFALENYDVIGGWRERYRVAQGGPGTERQVVPLSNGREASIYFAKAVDPTGETPDGKAFGDIAAYKRLLLRDRDQFGRALVHKLAFYATGAPVDFADRAVVEQILADTKARDHGLRSLVHAVVQSSLFLAK